METQCCCTVLSEQLSEQCRRTKVYKMMSSTGRMIARLKPHIPMIKFRAGVQMPIAAATSLESHNSSTSSSKQRRPVIDLSQLPLKFRRAHIETDEMEYIMRGGPDL